MNNFITFQNKLSLMQSENNKTYVSKKKKNRLSY
jgi:hypothetical protein